jgi:hypothetical protein
LTVHQQSSFELFTQELFSRAIVHCGKEQKEQEINNLHC